MPSLLTIPDELRDEIIELVLLNERPPPQDVSAAEPGRTNGVNLDYGQVRAWTYGPEHVRYEKGQPVANATGLLLTDRKLNNQTKAAIHRIFPNGMRYSLDVLFVEEQELWPTWTSVPAVSKHVDVVDVNFRIFGTNMTQRSAFRIGDGSPEQIVWCFYYLLERFLDHGLQQPPSSKEENSRQPKLRMAVNTINLNFFSGDAKEEPEDTEENHQAFRIRQRQLRRRRDEAAGALSVALPMHPQWLASFAAREFQMLTGMSYYTSSYGSLLFARMGTINFSSKGELIRRIDIASIFGSLSCRPDTESSLYTGRTFGNLMGECRLLTFWNWKYKTLQTRISLGLPVPDAEYIQWPCKEEMREWKRLKEEELQKRDERSYNSCGQRCRCGEKGLLDMLESSDGNSRV